MTQTHWKQLVNLDYIGAYSLTGKDMILTIKNVTKELVTGNNGKKEECIICYFKEPNVKPMILNRTNCKIITKLHNTPIIEEWHNKQIQIYATTTKVGGETVECLRIRDYISKPTIVEKCADCQSEITAANGMTAEAVANYTEKKYGVRICSECGKIRKDKMESIK